MPEIAPEIFKAYDIRGVVGKSLTTDGVRLIGQALGSELIDRSPKDERLEIAVGRDGRLSGPELAGALMEGIRASGVDVAEIGMFATPVAYFAAHELGCGSAVAVTGSHNPPEYNGLKMVLAGTTLAGDDVQALRHRIESGKLARGEGRHRKADIREAYLRRIVSDVRLARPLFVQGSRKLSLSAEVFNLFNTNNVGGFGARPLDASGRPITNYLLPTAAFAARQAQVGVRAEF